MTAIYYESDGDLDAIKGERVAVVGYGNQGRSWAMNLRDSGCADVAIGVRQGGSWKKAEGAGFKVMSPADAAKWADVVMVLTPDELQGDLYREALGPNALLSYRISLLDLVPGGQTWEETTALAQGLVERGVDVLSSGIGWPSNCRSFGFSSNRSICDGAPAMNR